MGISTLLPQTIGQVGDLTKIYNFLKPLIPTRYFKAIKILFTPCCELGIVSISAVCSGASVSALTFTLSGPTSFYDAPTWVLEQGGVPLAYTSVSYSNGVLTFTGVTGITSGSKVYSVTALVPTSSDGDVGVYLTTVGFTVTIPSCG